MADSGQIIDREYVKMINDLAKAFGILDDSVTKNKKSSDDLTAAQKQLITLQEKLKATESGVNDELIKTKIAMQNATKERKAAIVSEQDLTAAQKQLIALQEKLKATEGGVNDELIKTKIAMQNATKERKAAIVSEQAQEGSLVKMRQTLSELTKAYDNTGTRTAAHAKEIKSLSLEIGKAEEQTNRFTRGVGGYANQLGQLSPAAGNVINSTMGMVEGFKGLSLWEYIILAPIAAIVAAFVGLYAVFTSTASGAKFMKEIFAEVGAIFDVFRQRAVILIDVLKNFSWDKLKEVFGGMGKQMSEAAKAAKELTDEQLALNRALVFHEAEEVKERDRYQELLFLSKDQTKTFQERKAYLKEALELSKEMSETQIKFAERQFDIDVKEAANKTKAIGITQEQIKAFVNMSSIEKDEAIKTQKVYSDFYNSIGKDGVEKLISSFSKGVEAHTAFFEGNKRAESQFTGFIQKENAEREKAQKDALDKQLKNIDDNAKKQTTLLNNQQIAKLAIDEKNYSDDVKNDLKVLEDKRAALKKFGQSTVDIDKEISEKRLSESEKLAKSQEEIEKKKVEEQKKIDDDIQKVVIQGQIDDAKNEYDRQLVLLKAKSKNEQEYAQMKFDLDKKIIQSALDADMALLASADLTAEQRKSLAEKIEKENAQLDGLLLDTTVKTDKKKEASMKDVAKESLNLANKIFEFQNSKYEDEIKALEEKNKKGLLSNKELARQTALIQIKEAKSKKEQASISIAIDTAVAVQKLWGTGPLAPIMIALAIASGIIQEAIVLKQPLPTVPSFWAGTKNAPLMGIFGDRGFEIMQTPGGEMFSANRPTMFAGNKFKGSHILTNRESVEFMNNTMHSGFEGQSFSDSKIVSELMEIKNVLKNQPKPIYEKNNNLPIGYEQMGMTKIMVNRRKF